MSLAILIVDDDPLSIKSLELLISKVPELFVCGSETDPVLALSKIASGTIQADIILLDIDMPDLDGMEMEKQLNGQAAIIFITGHVGYALKAYNTDAADFLTKPVELPVLLRAIKKAKEKLIARDKISASNRRERSIFVKLSPRNMVRVMLDNLVYIEVDDKYLDLHLLNDKPLSIKKSLSYAEDLLPKDIFLRISKSCIVNLDRIVSIVGNRVIMDAAPVLEIGSTYLDKVYSRYNSL